MDDATVQLRVQTPHQTVFQAEACSVRFPTQTGLAGLRPRSEGSLVAVEPGIVQVRPCDPNGNQPIFVATAGGLLLHDGRHATLLTPLAFSGPDEHTLIDQLDQSLSHPDSELNARVTLSKLEGRIIQELRERED